MTSTSGRKLVNEVVPAPMSRRGKFSTRGQQLCCALALSLVAHALETHRDPGVAPPAAQPAMIQIHMNDLEPHGRFDPGPDWLAYASNASTRFGSFTADASIRSPG